MKDLTLEQIKVAEQFKDFRIKFFKPKEHNELHCFDLAVTAYVTAQKQINPKFNGRGFAELVGMRFLDSNLH